MFVKFTEFMESNYREFMEFLRVTWSLNTGPSKETPYIPRIHPTTQGSILQDPLRKVVDRIKGP